MARSDPRRVLAAQLAGIAARCAEVRAITADEAVAAMRARLAESGITPGTEAARRALTMAADGYRHGSASTEAWWFPDAIAVLVQAGADAP